MQWSHSIAFMRGLDEDKQLFLLRGKKNSTVNYYDEKSKQTISIKQSELADKLPFGKEVKKIVYKKKKVTIFVNEYNITISRDATKMIAGKNGKRKLQRTKGKTLKLRFIVERLVNDKNEVVAEWLLVSNLFDEEIDAKTLAQWYYYRWKIESYFKLLKSSGFNLEEWQQKEPLALFKRLLIISNACILIWKIANDNSDNTKAIRDFLISLSGKQIQRGVDFTYPSLLSGLESYLATLDLLRQFSVEDIFKMRDELVEIIGIEI
ncbi:MAG: transposase [Sulfurimonas sp.]|nr:transposase [Sulfurimonas sp.]